MINFDNSCKLEFCGMGLFETENRWIHPTVAVDTFELIFCVAGQVKIFENKKLYNLTAGNLLLLEPNILHGGYEESSGKTSFYWLHFKTDGDFKIPKFSADFLGGKRIFRELSHFSQLNPPFTEVLLAKLLFELGETNTVKSKISHEISEYIRINSASKLTVNQIAEKFGYSPDYITRIYKKEFGDNIKNAIINNRLNYIKSLLLNTNDSIKAIAEQCDFDSDNEFIKFFKYNAGQTPTNFRNRFYKLHMNNK